MHADPAPATRTARLVVAECVDVILDASTSQEELRTTINHLADHFAAVAGFHHEPTSPATTGNEIHLTTGTAISPHDAANCLRDIRRTTAFLNGIHQALRDLLDRRTQRPVRVLYAGCGPFAALITPLLHRFSPDEIRIVLMDVQPESLSSARRLIRQLGHVEFIEAYLAVDAATWCNETGKTFQLLVTETMQAALAKECHVAIAANLSATLDSDGIMIPEQIRLDAILLDPAKEFSTERMSEISRPDDRITLGTAFILDLASASTINRNHGPDFSIDHPIPCAELQVPHDGSPTHEIWISTTITTYGHFRIDGNDSGLTLPCPADITPPPTGGDLLAFSYVLGPKPHLHATSSKP